MTVRPGGPPKVPLDKMNGSSEARITGEPGGVPPLEDLRAGGFRDKQRVGGHFCQGGDGALCLLDPFLNLPLAAPMMQGGGRMGLESRSMRSGENWQERGSGVHVLGPWAIGKCVDETPQEEPPPCMPGVQPLCAALIFQVLVVDPYHEQECGALQPVTPFLQREHHCQQLPIEHVIARFCGRQPPAEKGIGVEFLFDSIPL